ncbi:MAG: CRISPR-associated protein Cas5 [Candidatus Omnitrophica bacterium]|nr:CRISPR-associated protein Cas5 [Candidatus Omnitrophota bacterium]
MEISGNTAMWTRPDTGDCPVSYPAPTFSAAKGIFESVLWGPAVQIEPTKVEICMPLQYHNYQTNYGGPLRKGGVVKSGGGFQLLATPLIDVCYRLYATVAPVVRQSNIKISESARCWDGRTTSPGHAYQAIFNRRLKRGQCFSIPFLGWKEFGSSYWGPFREKTAVQKNISTVIPSMLREVFSNGYASDVNFSFDQNVSIKNGILIFPCKEVAHAE